MRWGKLAFITEWTEKLIIIILIATMLELFLPDNRFQAYIKIVMGLLIILVMLDPLANLLHLHMPSINQVQSTSQQSSTEKNKIKKLKNEIDQQNAAYIQKQMVVQLKDMVNKEVQDTYGYQIMTIEMKMAASKESQAKQVDHLTVYLSKHAAVVNNKSTDITVLPIKTVNINENSASKNIASKSNLNLSQKKQLELIHLLAAKWDVDPSIIEIKSVEGNSAS